MLLDAGAPVDARGVDSLTALMVAAQNGKDAVVQALLGHGADPALQDNAGRTAADFARGQAHETLAAFIATHAASGLEPVQREPHAGRADGS